MLKITDLKNLHVRVRVMLCFIGHFSMYIQFVMLFRPLDYIDEAYPSCFSNKFHNEMSCLVSVGLLEISFFC